MFNARSARKKVCNLVRRGFKAQCEQISKRYRKELDLTLQEALRYQVFAKHMGIRIWTPADVPGLTDMSLRQLMVHDDSDWSAVTIQDFKKTVIVVNSSHSERRLANDVTHEISHIILDHQKARLEVSDEGDWWLKAYRSDQEDEADWLAAALLLPRDGLMACYRKTKDFEELAGMFEVSVDLVRMRINRTGIARQLQYSRKIKRA